MTTRSFSVTGFIVATAVALFAAEPPQSLKERLPRLAPKEPAEALKTFKVLDGFRMDLVASEPQLASPVAAVYDEDGRLYVVEMRDYPTPLRPGETPRGRVRLLEDRDGDGVYETATVFADGLHWPTGIACWDGGVFVTAPPDIWYFKDTDGDGKADVRRKVYTGFVVYNVQALVNGLQWGVDNRIYGVTAANGGEIRPGDRPNAAPISVRGRDFRFDPKSDHFEAISGTAQFGNAFDDWYHRFLSANRLVTGHVVLPAHALARNPFLPVARTVQDCAAEGVDVPLPMYQISPPEPWRVVRTERYHAEGQKLPLSEMVVTGIFTSGTGITIYRGAAYPERYRGQAFVGNVAGNLVHRRTLEPNGATFTARRVDEKCEFVASTDNWFRPVNFVNAPDGTLHVIDMYREVVEHPWSIPEDIKAHLDLESGQDRGRIYRLTPPGFMPPKPPRLGRATTAELVATLENPNSWWRETAQRLLYQRQDAAAVELLRRLARASEVPLARLHALGTLHGLGALEPVDISAALRDPAAGVREQTVQFAEPRLAKTPELAAGVRGLADDPDVRVRFRAAIALGALPDEAATAALTRIARRDIADPWARLAVLSSSAERSVALFAALLHDAGPQETAFLGQLSSIIGSRRVNAETSRVLELITAPGRPRAMQRDLLLGMGEGLLRTGRTLDALKMPAAARNLLDELVRDAERTAVDRKAAITDRTAAIQLLAHAPFDRARPTLRQLLDVRQPQEVQQAGVRALRNTGAAGVPAVVLDAWPGFTPAVRGEAVTALASRAPWALALLDAVTAKSVPAAHIDSTRRAVLLRHRDITVRSRAADLLGDSAKTPRSEIVARYKPSLELKGDAKRGLAVFQRECATCHLAGTTGHNVGPSIASMGVKRPDEYLVAILDPNREVDPRYLNYTVNTTDGRVTSGIIAAETATAVTLKRADGQTETILRSQIEELSSTGQSLMPEGVEQKVSQMEMADLIAFLVAVAQGTAP